MTSPSRRAHVSEGSEDELLRWLRRRLPQGLIGDDAAILPRAATWAVTMDTQIEGVHFLPGLAPGPVARRLLAVNLSDLAAMGASPAYAFLSLSAPPGFDHRRFFRAFLASGRQAGVVLAGGDLSRQERLIAVLTLLGEKTADSRWLHRSTAQAGHNLWVGGTLGEAALGLALLRAGARLDSRRIVLPKACTGLPATWQAAARRAIRRHLQPRPQLALGTWLGTCPAGAAIDLSDGLARDLHRLCRESRVGAEVTWESLPRPRLLSQLAKVLDLDPYQLVLAGGEDYVLLFTLPKGIIPPSRFGCHRIGRLHASRNVTLIHSSRRQPLPDTGWDHLAAIRQREV